MQARSWCFLLAVFVTLLSHAQSSSLSGRVLNEKNEPVSGASVKITNGPGASTDIDGHFSFALETGRKYEIVVTAIGYSPKTVSDIEVISGQVNEVNIVLSISSKDMGNIVISARSSARRETVNSLLTFQKNTNTVASVISAEAIRRSPDRNTGEVLKRV
ncbi:MAG TPA: carboxypeptidase-like regulatory domain-containing protein, partial [Flavisolibacter sp.]|nr:carboxypeptidase-like regulatory domain-containing protein [Flavisolibacter sp.]